jgi:alpha,alpha-trehalase
MISYHDKAENLRIHILIFLLLLKVIGISQPLTPKQQYGNLFIAVQTLPVFNDQKTFVDCTAKENPDLIVEEYEREKLAPGFDLKKFVSAHFYTQPDTNVKHQSVCIINIKCYINTSWPSLTQKADKPGRWTSLLPLPKPYVIPGSRFREAYYWDSYFIELGLAESRDTLLVQDMVENFAALIDKYGFVPNANRSYYLTRSQPPFFSLMVQLLAGLKGDTIYKLLLPELKAEYTYWMRGYDTLEPGKATKNVVNFNGALLNRYWDDSDEPREESFTDDVATASATTQKPRQAYREIRAAAESGWDFSSRWFADGKNISTIHTTQVLPVDLNCLLYNLEKTIALAYDVDGDTTLRNDFEQKAAKRKAAIAQVFWSSDSGYFCDYLLHKKCLSTNISLAGLFPLFFQIASPGQAVSVMEVIKTKFEKSGGLVTTLSNTGQQWDSPNGWAPLEYIGITGLANYGYKDLAREIATRWFNLNLRVFKNTGKLFEKYDVENPAQPGVGGEYNVQIGFGWTNGVLLKLMKDYNLSDE